MDTRANLEAAALERAAVRNQRRPLGLEHRKDRAGRVIRVGLPAGRGHALVEEPRIELGVAGEPQPRREPPLADRPDLVLDLAASPSPRRAYRPPAQSGSDCTTARSVRLNCRTLPTNTVSTAVFMLS